MKRLAIGFLAALALSFGSTASAYTGTYPAGTGIDGTVHDLSTVHNGMNYVAVPPDPLTRKCIFCHAPHNTYRLTGTTAGLGPIAPTSAFDYLPLWNHELQADIGYTMYENGAGAPQSGHAASQAILLGMVPGSTSLLCLSCHDGSVAVNSYGNAFQKSESTGTTKIVDQYAIGKDKYLGNHHPIGFNYDSVEAGDKEADGGIRPSSNLMTTGTTIADHLYNGNMECGTCHSVHNKGNTGETLLWRTDQNSGLCLTCHNKGQYVSP